MRWPNLALLATAAWFMAGCGQNSDNGYTPKFGQPPTGMTPEYIFAARPVHNPKLLFEVYGPLIDYLNAHTRNAHFQLQASCSFADFEKDISARRFHFALPNPYETINTVRHGYRIFGKMGNDDMFRGVILVRRDSTIQNIVDLRGKTVSFPAPTSLAATLMPQHLLHTQGIDVNRDIKMLYSGSHESSIMNVYLGNAAAGTALLPTWQAFSRNRPDIASRLVVRWQTDTLPNNGLVVRDDVPDAVTDQVKTALFSLHNSADGRAILARIGASSFVQADDRTYDPVRNFVRQFNQQVRPIEMEVN